MEMQTAKGVRDLPPEEKQLQIYLTDVLRGIFELYGFQPLETPTLERYETLSAKEGVGEESDVMKETFQLKDQGDRKLGLRFDLTVPLARYMTMNPTLKLPFKRYEFGKVFRDGPIKLGRSREFWQCDGDIIGSSSMLADTECLAILNTAFSKLGLDVVIKVNNRKLLNSLLEAAGISQKEEAIITLDKLEKIGFSGVEKELKEKSYSKKQLDNLFSLLKKADSLDKVKKLVNDKTGVEELEELFSYCKDLGLKNVVFDFTLARGLAYYTGTVFEAYLKKGEVTSSLAGGGRYDQMIGKFSGGSREVPAVGLSFGLVPIMEALKEKKKYDLNPPAKVYVLPINTVKESLELAKKLREEGISASLSLGKKGVSKNLEYAGALGIHYTAILGEDELKKNKILLREMDSGAEQLLTFSQLVSKLKKEK